MNWQHFTAFVWLRWRLMRNQWRRAGSLNAALLAIVTVGSAIAAIPFFIGTLVLGIYLIPRASPAILMYVWDGLIFFFLLFWAIGLLTELQRNDPLALSKFLHLPVSVNGAFLINFVSSLLRLSLLIFGPIMLAYALALVYVQGWAQLPVLPALAAFLLLITAPTYQFQGWLASMMTNPRRRRSVVILATMSVVLIFQLPNVLNIYYTPKYARRQNERTAARLAEEARLQQAAIAKEVDSQEFLKRQQEINERYTSQGKREFDEERARWERLARIVNTVVPLGWLPMGVMSSAEGRIWPSLLGIAGMTSIGAFSLWRAYRTTLGQFQGQASNRKGRAPSARLEAASRRPGGRLLEARLPWLSEPVSAIALGGFQSVLRSPEAKITLLMPLIMGGVFGGILLQGRQNLPEMVRPLLGIASIGLILFSLLALMGNQFGIDRDGFRVFVLCAAPRREILLGKNLAFLPFAVVISAIFVIALQILCPMRIDHALSMIPQFVTMFALFAAMANLFSIYAPVFITPGSLKAAHPKMSTILLQLLMFMILFPLCQGLSLIPLGVEALLKGYGVAQGVPACLLLSLALCMATVLFYWASLGWLGSALQSREQKILEVVTNKAA